MKNNQWALTLILSCAFIMSEFNSNAQTNSSGYSFAANHFVYDYGDEHIVSNIPLNEIKPSMFRRFMKDFPSITFQNWSKTNNGYFVTFGQTDSIWGVETYDLTGSFRSRHIYYNGRNMPARFIKIASEYCKEYIVDLLTEYCDGKNSVYEIIVHNEDLTKKIRIQNTAISVSNEYEAITKK